MEIKQVTKSRTMGFNALLALLVPVLPQLGVTMTPEMVALIAGFGNMFLRFMTNSEVGDK